MPAEVVSAINLESAAIEWTTLKRIKGVAQVHEQRRAAVEFPADSPGGPAAPELPALLKKTCGHLRGRIVLGLPSDQVLLRILDLPATDWSELHGMVELQVDKFSPFPVEKVAIAFEILQQTGSTSRVLIAAVRLELMEQLGTAFRAAGLRPLRMDVDILGWWQALQENHHIQEQGRHAMLIMSGARADFVVFSDGVPVLFHPMEAIQEGSSDARMDELVEEINYTLTVLEAEWGPALTPRLDLWTAVEPPEGLTRRLAAADLPVTQARRLGELPPLTTGLARRALRDPGASLNLAPAAWAQDARKRALRRRLISVTAVFLGLWISTVTVFLVGLSMQRNRTEGLAIKARELEQAGMDIRRLKDKVVSLEQYADRSRSALECLREISALMPEGVDLTSFIYKKGSDCNLRGLADSESPIIGFIEQLEGSRMFREIKSGGITRQQTRQGEKAEFNLTTYLAEVEP